jgi:hypothetical protein
LVDTLGHHVFNAKTPTHGEDVQMSAEYTLIEELNLKYVTISGETSLSELRDLARQYIDDPGFSLGQRQFIDLSSLVNAKARFLDVMTLRNFYLREYGTPARPIPVSIFAPTDLGYGISKMFTSLMVGQKLMKIKIFEHKTDALAWLDIDSGSQSWTEAKASVQKSLSSSTIHV